MKPAVFPRITNLKKLRDQYHQVVKSRGWDKSYSMVQNIGIPSSQSLHMKPYFFNLSAHREHITCAFKAFR